MANKNQACSECKEIKPITDFPFKYKAKNIRHYKCKQCQRKYNKKYNNGEIIGPHGNLGKKRPAHSEKMSGHQNPMFGTHRPQYVKDKISKTRKEKGYVGEKNPLYGTKNIKLSIIMKEKWKDPIFRKQRVKQTLRGLKKSINKAELKLNNILTELFPNAYKFVGNGKVILDGFCPDFINEKKIIELYGDYWHNLSDWKERDKRREKVYKQLGYKMLIVWEHELKDFDILKKKLLSFNRSI